MTAAVPETSQYIEWPGSATFPGAHTFPGWDDRADGSTTVLSHRGWEWVETTNEYQNAVAALAQAATEAALRRVETAFGQVYYIKGGPDTVPSFDGGVPGDTCRVQDAATLNIVAEWRWTGTAWERMMVSGHQVSNLDVGRLTAGSAAIPEIVSRKIASDIGQFLSLTTEQLTVSGSASFNEVIAHEMWSRVVTAADGEFERIRAGMIESTAFEGQTFTGGLFKGTIVEGGTIRTSDGDSRTEITQESGLRVVKDGQVVVHASDTVQSGLALRNPTNGVLTPVAETVFGAYADTWYGKEVNSHNPRVGSQDVSRHLIRVPAPASSRMLVIVTSDYNTGAQSPRWRWARVVARKGSTEYASIILDYQYRNTGWDSGTVTVTGLLNKLPTSGEIEVLAEVWLGTARLGTSTFYNWYTTFASFICLPT